eukprot:8125901-Pyramimonas_sp.AAC.1
MAQPSLPKRLAQRPRTGCRASGAGWCSYHRGRRRWRHLGSRAACCRRALGYRGPLGRPGPRLRGGSRGRRCPRPPCGRRARGCLGSLGGPGDPPILLLRLLRPGLVDCPSDRLRASCRLPLGGSGPPRIILALLLLVGLSNEVGACEIGRGLPMFDADVVHQADVVGPLAMAAREETREGRLAGLVEWGPRASPSRRAAEQARCE